MKRVENQDYYQILEVPYKASWGEIQKAYELAKTTYSKGALATYSLFDFNERGRILDKIEEAYLVLSHPEKRVKYDRAIEVLLSSSVGANRADVATATATRTATPTATPTALPPPSTAGVTMPDVMKTETGVVTPVSIATPISVTIPVEVAMLAGHVSPAGHVASAVENEVVSGKTLKALREKKGVTLEQIADKTRININYLEFIEAGRYSSLPAPVYIVSYLKQYAKIIGIDSAILEEYMKTYQRWCDSPKPKERYR